MRTYIFTPKEREVVAAYLRGEIKASDDIVRQVLIRMRSFQGLSSDVDTYLILRDLVRESPSTTSA